jgi:hypothetical protein
MVRRPPAVGFARELHEGRSVFKGIGLLERLAENALVRWSGVPLWPTTCVWVPSPPQGTPPRGPENTRVRAAFRAAAQMAPV